MHDYLDNQKILFAFNIWDINSTKAVMDAVAKKKRSIILQTSSSIYDSIVNMTCRKLDLLC